MRQKVSKPIDGGLTVISTKGKDEMTEKYENEIIENGPTGYAQVHLMQMEALIRAGWRVNSRVVRILCN